MEKTKAEVRSLYQNIELILNSDDEIGIDCAYALSRTKSYIKNIVEEGNDQINTFQKEERKLAVKYCDKDKDGKPITSPIIEDGKITGERYSGLGLGKNTEYDEQIEAIIEKRNSYFKEIVEIKVHHIDMEKIPKKGKAFIISTLCELVE